ncbi:hypothetical protein AB6884_10325 [Carnobacterium maltaromaticum]|uniref:hypothetical protein n=1 Tax=Carnobacterium maltaromaticum TaxID=2751 RepID=UPI0039BE8841
MMEKKDNQNKKKNFQLKYKILIALLIFVIGIVSFFYIINRPVVLKDLKTEVFAFYPGNEVYLQGNDKLYNFYESDSFENTNSDEYVKVIILSIPSLGLERRLYPGSQNGGYHRYTENEIQTEIMDMITTDYEYQK